MEPEILDNVLTEVLEDLREIKQQQAEQMKVMKDMTDRVEAFNQTASTIKVSAPAVDTQAIALSIEEGINQIRSTIQLQPKTVIRQFRFLLFPEYYAEQYYWIVFGRLLFWMMIFLIATYLFVLGKYYLNNREVIDENERMNNQYKKAWQYLYKRENKKGKRKMDSAWYRY